MIVQINTDKSINWDKRHDEHFSSLIKDELDRFSSHITRIEVHLSDENGKKEGINDIRCLLEARIEGRQPTVITNQANTNELAISGAITKMKAAVKTIIERMNN